MKDSFHLCRKYEGEGKATHTVISSLEMIWAEILNVIFIFVVNNECVYTKLLRKLKNALCSMSFRIDLSKWLTRRFPFQFRAEHSFTCSIFNFPFETSAEIDLCNWKTSQYRQNRKILQQDKKIGNLNSCWIAGIFFLFNRESFSFSSLLCFPNKQLMGIQRVFFCWRKLIILSWTESLTNDIFFLSNILKLIESSTYKKA